MKWLPIETAPKDGTTVLVFSGNTKYKYIFIARWDSTKIWEHREEINGWIEQVEGEDYQILIKADYPTHWMPLPKPPLE